MTRRRTIVLVAALLSVSFAGLARDLVRAGSATLPEKLTDRDFWQLITDFSEPDGTFRSDNLLSNEIFLQYVIPDLVKGGVRLNRVYMGVGPEQNFTYSAALRPRMVFIVDIRRGNLQLHLMYKALFELSSDRTDFIFRLFSRRRPEGLSSKASANDIFEALNKAEPSELLFKQNLKVVQDQLSRKHRFPLNADDFKGIEYIYSNFSWHGPGLTYWSSNSRATSAPTYWDLMVADDGKGQMRSYLVSEENFQFLKELHEKNLFVPVVGNFAGPKAIRAVGRYLKERDASVAAFYLSNVEQYLGREGTWSTFCSNVASLPLDDTSMFIRSVRNASYTPGIGLSNELGNMSEEVKGCAVR
jgi:hypothetical protein